MQNLFPDMLHNHVGHPSGGVTGRDPTPKEFSQGLLHPSCHPRFYSPAL